MEVFVSTTWNGKAKSNIIHTLSMMSKLKCDGYELGSTHYPIDLTSNSISKLILGKKIITHNFFPPTEEDLVLNIASNDKKILDKSLLFCLNAIDRAKEIGAEKYTIHPGFVQTPVITKEAKQNYDFKFIGSPDSRKNSFKIMVQSLKILLNRAIENNIELLIETEGSLTSPEVALMEKPDEYKKLFKIFPENLGLNFNLAHSYFASKYYNFELSEFIKEYISIIKVVELSHNNGKSDQHLPLTNTSKIFDFFTLLKDKIMILEFRNAEVVDIEKSIFLLREFHSEFQK